MFDKMKQAGSLMKQMNSLKKKIDKLETLSESKDGRIQVTIQGTSKIKSIKIDDELLENISSKDLEKSLINTVNDALNNAEKSSKQIMSEMTGGLNIPGL
ncbi:MAG: nucleoid-associated protein, YbaB/EbfC family [Chloroflexi bacterium]|jgi:DNA-binding YbaB/EbfC family protein|nr:MAG: YbaB/EbfC family nucleoid-associated protein [SAR202 cluster bacterium]KAA1299084.1 MAG: YbaB/EbfC family nucleoid-associated protein [SAR202 cluster bacterium]MAX12268.1 nucleoid-associated protein, YbaB/EbfC family [Chloroflexota bacterium]MQG12705.1 YbaB/EbfC family nucleoid-associated protein [SAR202 cluster bacterium]|tara:strand:+ start:1621 stop:1920 length:300 start_codon:yes stop_codon:yes gene_type:complete